MKSPEAPRLPLDNRTLWEAIRAAGGNVPMAAQTLGLTTRALLLQIAEAKSMGWTTHRSASATSGTRRREDEPKPKRDSDDALAWGDDGDSD